MIGKKALSIILNNPELYEKIPKGLVWGDEKTALLFNIISLIKNKHGKYNKDLILDYIEQNKNFDVNEFYQIYDLNCLGEEKDLDLYLNELLTRKIINELDFYVKSLRKDHDKNIVDIKIDLKNIHDNILDVSMMNYKSIQELCKEAINRLHDTKKEKVYSAIHFFEKGQGGYGSTDYILLTGMESVGKTGYVLDKIQRQLEKGMKVTIFTFEVKKERMIDLLACQRAKVDTRDFDRKTFKIGDKEKIEEAYAYFYEKGLIIIDEKPRLNKIISTMKILKNEDRSDFFYIDYLHKIKLDKFYSEYDRIQIISDAMKEMTVILNTPIFCIALLNKDGKQASEPEMWHIKGNGDIGYDADVTMFLRNTGSVGNCRLITNWIKKNRYGDVGKFEIRFDPTIREFEDNI
jgi:replicative DNA helicase